MRNFVRKYPILSLFLFLALAGIGVTVLINTETVKSHVEQVQKDYDKPIKQDPYVDQGEVIRIEKHEGSGAQFVTVKINGIEFGALDANRIAQEQGQKVWVAHSLFLYVHNPITHVSMLSQVYYWIAPEDEAAGYDGYSK